MSDKNKEKNFQEEDVLTENSQNKYLILHNDDFHTFEYVIDALIDICKHKLEQAVQCTYLVHYTGKADVKKGSFDYLKPYKEKFIDIGLEATIN